MDKRFPSIFNGYVAMLCAAIVAALLTGCSNSSSNQNAAADSGSMSVVLPADKIEVVHFHATQQCWSCITVGELALKTIKEKFPDEYADGTIVYMDINGELPENSAMVTKYQAGGSSLFTNSIQNGKETIREDVNVWRYVSNETRFIGYFEKKLTTLLGK